METRFIPSASGGSRSVLTLGASPAVYQNATSRPQSIVISGGTVTAVAISRDGVTYDVVGLLAGAFTLLPGDRIKVTYAVTPTVATAYPL